MITDRNARRLAASGVNIPRNADGKVDAIIEIAPERVLDEADAAALAAATGLKNILPGQVVTL
jgi:hypothetical protein